jgi:periplasmic copper chaperone A
MRSRWRWRLVSLLIVLAACTGTTSEAIAVRDAWSREAPGMSQMAGVFMVIENRGSTADALVGASTALCEVVELHESVFEDDVMKMRPVTGGRIEIPPGQTIELKSGGLHVMLIGLQEKLVPEESFELALEFEQAGKMVVEVIVREAGVVEMEQ